MLCKKTSKTQREKMKKIALLPLLLANLAFTAENQKEFLIENTIQLIDAFSPQCSAITQEAIAEKNRVTDALGADTRPILHLTVRESTLDAAARYKLEGSFMQEKMNRRYAESGCTSKSSSQSCKDFTEKKEMLNEKIATMIKALNEYEEVIKQVEVDNTPQ